MPDSKPSSPRENDFVTTSPLMPSLLTIKCTCGEKFDVSLDDVHLKETIASHSCCKETAPMADLQETISLFSKYVEARAKLVSTGWDAELTAPPWNC